MPKPKPDAGDVSREDVDRGFFEAGATPRRVLGGGALPPPLPPAGPARARATLIKFRATRPGPQGPVKVRLRCPPPWPSGAEAALRGQGPADAAPQADRYRIGRRQGAARIRFQLHRRLRSRTLERKRAGSTLTIATRNRDRDGAERGAGSSPEQR